MFLSIIVPCYNVERWLRGCLDSICSQDFPKGEYEVIVVIDGSLDRSVEIAREVAAAEPNVCVIEQENRGLGGARNIGLEHARGEYVWFVDSDDTIQPGSIALICSRMRDGRLDYAGWALYRVYEDNDCEDWEPAWFRQPPLAQGMMMTGRKASRYMHTGISQKNIFSRRFLEENGLRFMQGIYYEDVEFTVRAISLAKSIAYYDDVTYRYLIRQSGNIMSDVSLRSVTDIVKIVDSWRHFLVEGKKPGWVQRYVSHNIFRLMLRVTDTSRSSHNTQIAEYYKRNRKEIWRIMAWAFLHSGEYITPGGCCRLLKVVLL